MKKNSGGTVKTKQKVGTFPYKDKSTFNATQTSQKTIISMLQSHAKNQPTKTAYTYLFDGEDQELHLTFAELDQKAKQIATLLQRHKLKGDRVLLLFPPCIDFIPAFFGCLYAGAIAIPAYPPKRNRSAERLNSIVADAKAKLVLTTEQILQNVYNRIDSAPKLSSLQWIATDTLVKDYPNAWKAPKITQNDIAFLQYTSGSTAEPKGVIVSHGNIIANEKMIKSGFAHSKDTIVLGWLPVFHDMGLIGNVFQPLFLGIHCILMSPVSFLQKPIRWLKAISKYKATTSGGPNFAYDLCVSHITDEEKQNLDLSTWTVAFNGAEPIKPETLTQFHEKFKDIGFKKQAFYPCYGMAETTLFVTGGYSDEKVIIKSFYKKAFSQNKAIEAPTTTKSKTVSIVGCGHAWGKEKIKVVDPKTSLELPTFSIGEVWVSGPHVAKGYWNKKEQTQNAFNAIIADTFDGPFLRTGDLGFIDEDGELYITGRIKELIILNGRNIYPQDIENTAENTCAEIRAHASAAFEIKHNNDTQLVVVSELERTAMRHMDKDAAIKSIIKAIAKKHDVQPFAIVFIKPGSMPMTSSGKIQRNLCQKKFLNSSLKVVAQWQLNKRSDQQLSIKQIELPTTEFEKQLVQIYKAIIKANTICINDDFLSIGGNSIMATQILSQILETFHIELTVYDLFEFNTISKLAKRIEEKQTEELAAISSDDLERLLSDLSTNEEAMIID